MIQEYLNYIQEVRDKLITQDSNAPCAAYETVYGKRCPQQRGGGKGGGRYSKDHETKTWNGIEVDGHLEDKWLNDLSKIKGIEIRSSCEGHEKDWVAFVIFRFTDRKQDLKRARIIAEKIESSDSITKVSYHIGRQGQMRFIVAAPTWYGKSEWKKWWSTLAARIRSAL